MKCLARVALCLLLLAGLLAVGAGTQDPGEDDWKAIQAIITSQLEAFKRDDAAAAFSFAAPSIQKQFHTPGEFMQMVRTGYSAVYQAGLGALPRSLRGFRAGGAAA